MLTRLIRVFARPVPAALTALLTGVLAVSLGTPAGAQTVRGVVTMPDGNTRAAGVIVAAAGDTGAPVRALTNQRGEYTIRLREPGRYTLRALRVGFLPTVAQSFTVAIIDTVTIQIQLTGVAVSLVAVTVKGDDVCRTRPDSGALVARAWEEARKAIMASQLSATDAPLVAEWIEYDRTLDPTARIVRGLRVTSTTNPTTHAFRSAPAELLSTLGYVIPTGDETTYHAPDGEVLLSDSFASTHCFQIVPPTRGADTLVGVAFRPAQDRLDIRDIEGTFWLDRRSAELRWMDYTYTNMPAIAEKASSGGRVEFLRLGTGGWMIGRWSIRMGEYGRTQGTSVNAGRVNLIRPTTNVLRAIQVTGGQVTKVMRGDSVVHVAEGVGLDVQVIERDPGVGAHGATVELAGTNYVARADRDGRARITPVLEGRYDIRVHTALMDSLGVPPVTHEIEIGARARRDSVRLPSAEDVLAAACKDSVRRGESLVRGVVRDTLGNAFANVSVIVTWQGQVKISPDRSADRIAWTEQSVGAMTDDVGRFRVCGVPREVLLIVRAKTDQLSDARRLTLEGDQALGAINLVPRPVAATADRLLPKPSRAMVEFSVTDEEGALLPGTTLEIQAPDGTTRTMSTGVTGMALLPDAAAGRLIVRARKIGFLPGQISATIAAGRNTIPIIMSSAGFPTLDTVRIIGDERKRNDRLDEFDTRRLNAAATRSITRAEIVKRNPLSAWHMLTNVSAMKVEDIGGIVRAIPTRVYQTSLVNPSRPCFMRVGVDGVVWPDEIPNLANLPPPDAIHGIEVFAGPASIPLQYGGTGTDKWCGLIMVWTR